MPFSKTLFSIHQLLRVKPPTIYPHCSKILRENHKMLYVENMFEFTNEPSLDDLMLHAAWDRQRRTLKTFLELQSHTRKTLTASHFTAAHLMGIPTPEFPRAIKLYACVKQAESRFRMHGVQFRTWNNTDTTGNTIEVAGILCSSPEATFAQLSRELTLEELIILGDSIVCRNPQLRRGSKQAISRYLRDCQPFRGHRSCLKALSQVRENTDSPAETKLRIMLRRYGFPDPEINHQLETSQSHYFLDMAYPEYKIGIEFNGQHHHQQIAHDWDRSNMIQSHGWKIFTVENENLGTTGLNTRFCDQLQSAIHQAGYHKFTRLNRPITLESLCDLRHGNRKSRTH